jgi:hypothetical protein
VVKVAVGVDDVNDGQSVPGQAGEDPVGIVPGINDHGLARLFTSQNETVCLNGAQGHLTDNQCVPPDGNRFFLNEEF